MKPTTGIASYELTKIIRDEYQIDAEDFRREIISRHGQKLELIQSTGYWVELLSVVLVGYGKITINWQKNKNEHPLIEWAFRTWAIERLENLVDLKPIEILANELKNLRLTKNNDLLAEEDVYKWTQAAINKALASNRPENAGIIRGFYLWCIEEELPYFEDYRTNQLSTAYPTNRHSGQLVSMLDSINGPHTQKELRAIEAELSARKDLIKEAAIYYICRDWGLRPIQLALMREDDFGTDEIGDFMMVVSVKGNRRAAKRRAKTNMIKRYISDETAQSIKHLIKNNAIEFPTLCKSIAAYGAIDDTEALTLPKPLFTTLKNKENAVLYLSNNSLRGYVLHLESPAISALFRSATDKLSISTSRANTSSDPKILQLGCYRLRRTKGTFMVLNGATPAEVAEALDHQTTDSIKHYFRITRDLIEYVNNAHISSKELSQAANAWKGRLISKTHSPPTKGFTVSDLGICAKGEICPHHPTVSCYSCSAFMPYREANHQKAKENISEFIKLVSEDSTGPIAAQLNEAAKGADAIIRAISDE